jgi:predicted nucleic acid-binding protein
VDLYTVDTIAFLAFIVDALPPHANAIFQKAENDEITLILPSIAIGEIIYTILKKKKVFGNVIPLEKISTIFEIIRDSESISLTDMNLECWQNLLTLDIPELHDRMVVATHLTYKSKAILTNDLEIAAVTQTIWL